MGMYLHSQLMDTETEALSHFVATVNSLPINHGHVCEFFSLCEWFQPVLQAITVKKNTNNFMCKTLLLDVVSAHML